MRNPQSLLIALLAAAACNASIVQFANPDAAYLGATTLLPITAPNYTGVSSLSDGTLTMTVSPVMTAYTVGSGWATWSSPPYSETSTPRLLTDYYSNDVWLNFSTPLSIFGFEAEPEPYGQHDITARFYNGSTLVGSFTRTAEGNAGARLFAAQTLDLPFTSVNVWSPRGFAMAQFRYDTAETATPEPGTWLLLMAGGAGLLLWRRRRAA